MKHYKIIMIVMVAILMAGCFLSGCNKQSNNSRDRFVSEETKRKSRNFDVDIRDRNTSGYLSEHRQENIRTGDSDDNNRDSNVSYDYSDDILSEGDVLALYNNGNTKYGSYFIYQGRSDIIEREKLIQIVFWSLVSCILGVTTGILIALNNTMKIKKLIKNADVNNDGKINIEDIKSIIR